MRGRSLAAAAAALAGAALALALASGCGKSSSSTQPATNVGTPADLGRAIAAAIVPGAVLPTNADTSASLMATMDVLDIREALALFYAGGALVDAGAVTTRVTTLAPPGTANVALDRSSVNVLGHPQYFYSTFASHPVGIAIPFDATSYQRFDVAGSGGFPALTDSILSVDMITVSAPVIEAGVKRSSDLVVAWSNPESDTTVYVQCAVSSYGDTSHVALGVLVPDPDGATDVPSARLQTLPAGLARLSVARYRLVYHGSGVSRIGLACEAVDIRSITLQ